MIIKLINIIRDDIKKFQKDEIFLNILVRRLRINISKLREKKNNKTIEKLLSSLFFEWSSIEIINAGWIFDSSKNPNKFPYKSLKKNKKLKDSIEKSLSLLKQIEKAPQN